MNIENLRVIGANFRTSTQDFRDAFEAGLTGLRERAAVLATCNRVEAYFFASSDFDVDDVVGRVRDKPGRDMPALRSKLDIRTGIDAAHHLMRVAGGLDSLVVGEDQILGQVGAAGREISPEAAGASELRELFQQAVKTGRRVRAGHRLAGDTSLAEAGVHWLARQRPQGLTGATVTLIGAGKMARSAAATLVDSGVSRLLLVNRNVAHAEHIASVLGRGLQIEPHPLSNLACALRVSDVVVGATRSPRPVVTVEHLKKAKNGHGQREWVLLDLATPRDIDPQVRSLTGVTLIDLDDLSQALGGAASADVGAVRRAEELARAGAIAYVRWLRTRQAAPAIVRYRRRAKQMLDEETRRLGPQLSAMTVEQREAVVRALRRLTNSLTHAPTLALRRAAQDGQLADLAELLATRGRSPTGASDSAD